MDFSFSQLSIQYSIPNPTEKKIIICINLQKLPDAYQEIPYL
jgi:hypothetical protein